MRKRSAYRPKGVRLDAMAHVLTGLRPMTEVSETTTLRIRNHAALAALAAGTGTRQDVDAVVAALNITEALAKAAVGEVYQAEIRAGQDALLASARRGLAANEHYAFTPDELSAINVAMEVHDAQLDVITVQQLEQAMAYVQRVKRSGAARAIK